MPKDRVQREIEEILDKLDTFVPEERFTAKMRARQKEHAAPAGPSPLERALRPFTRITLGHLLLAGLALFAIAFLFDDQLGSTVSMYMKVVGVLLAGSALLFSVLNGGNTRLRVDRGGKVQKRWRGQVIEYHEPGRVDRVRGWFRRRREG